jgi:hypothetical protein
MEGSIMGSKSMETNPEVLWLRYLFQWAIEVGRIHAIRYLLDLYENILSDYHDVTGKSQGVVHPALKKICDKY